MRVSSKGRYAIVAVLDVAGNAGAKPVSLADVAVRQRISLSYLEQLFAMLRRAGLVAAFKAAGVNLDRPVIASCGSGMTACVLLFALHLIGKHDVALYDGSWAEWGLDPETPKALGKA